MTRDYARGYYDAMQLAIQFGRTLEGDCGDIETNIINDEKYQTAETMHFLRKP